MLKKAPRRISVIVALAAEAAQLNYDAYSTASSPKSSPKRKGRARRLKRLLASLKFFTQFFPAVQQGDRLRPCITEAKAKGKGFELNPSGVRMSASLGVSRSPGGAKVFLEDKGGGIYEARNFNGYVAVPPAGQQKYPSSKYKWWIFGVFHRGKVPGFLPASLFIGTDKNHKGCDADLLNNATQKNIIRREGGAKN